MRKVQVVYMQCSDSKSQTSHDRVCLAFAERFHDFYPENEIPLQRDIAVYSSLDVNLELRPERPHADHRSVHEDNMTKSCQSHITTTSTSAVDCMYTSWTATDYVDDRPKD